VHFERLKQLCSLGILQSWANSLGQVLLEASLEGKLVKTSPEATLLSLTASTYVIADVKSRSSFQKRPFTSRMQGCRGPGRQMVEDGEFETAAENVAAPTGCN
jgi:hypothetical protein